MKVKLTQNYNGNFRGETIEVDDLLGRELIKVDMAIMMTWPKDFSKPVTPITEDLNKAIIPDYPNTGKVITSTYKNKK